MFDPNISNTPLLPMSHSEAADMEMLEDEMRLHLEQNAPELVEPYGTREMINVSPELAIGELACMAGEDSKADDMPAPNPPPPSSKMTGDVFEMSYEEFYGASDVNSIF
jgi:hypothetical protein